MAIPEGRGWCSRRDSNSRSLPYKGSALPLSYGSDALLATTTIDDYSDMGRRMVGLGLPSMVVMEGGYAVDDLGINTVNFIEALAQELVGIGVEVVLASIVERLRKITQC